tara:strand:+ start:779 stop:1129 length:351 start_codon:yes stop_codon:yes gene_type:complete
MLGFMGLLAAHASNVQQTATALGGCRNTNHAMHTPRLYPARQVARIVNAYQDTTPQQPGARVSSVQLEVTVPATKLYSYVLQTQAVWWEVVSFNSASVIPVNGVAASYYRTAPETL